MLPQCLILLALLSSAHSSFLNQSLDFEQDNLGANISFDDLLNEVDQLREETSLNSTLLWSEIQQIRAYYQQEIQRLREKHEQDIAQVKNFLKTESQAEQNVVQREQAGRKYLPETLEVKNEAASIKSPISRTVLSILESEWSNLFSYTNNVITFTGQASTQMLGSISHPQDSLEITFRVLDLRDNVMGIGIIDSDYKVDRWSSNYDPKRPNIFLYSSYGFIDGQGKGHVKYSGEGFRDRDSVAIIVSFTLGTIEWKINGVAIANHQTEVLKSKEVEWKPLIIFTAHSQKVEWIP